MATEGAFSGADGSVGLRTAQDAGDRLSAMVVARVSTRATNAVYSNWARRGACAQGDETIAVIAREASERAQDCARVTTWTNPAQRPPSPAGSLSSSVVSSVVFSNTLAPVVI